MPLAAGVGEVKREYERAKIRGVEARQRGKKPDANPYQSKPTLRVLAEAWLQGWQAQDAINRRRA